MYKSGNLMSRINRLTNRKINELLKESNITEFNNAQGTIMYALCNNQEMSIREISEKTCLAMSTLTTMLERMKTKGLVEMYPNPKDARSTLVRLSEDARQYAESFDSIASDMFSKCFKGFTKKEISTFEGMLERILNNLEEK